jgi:hypothetical protein
VIEDLDHGDPGPSRAGAVRAISVVLALGALIGYAALTSPTLRGPYATPDPGAGVSFTKLDVPRYTPEPLTLINSPVSAIWIACAPRGFVYTTTGSVFVNGQPVSVTGPDRQVTGVPEPKGQSAGVNVPVPLAPGVRSYCLVPEPPVPFDRFAR